MRQLKTILILALLLLPLNLFAAVTATLSVDNAEASISDTIALELTVAGSRNTDMKPGIEGLNDFVVNSGGSSTSVNFINGSYSSSISYRYFLRAKAAGDYNIGPALIKVDGKIYKSNIVSVKITESRSPQTGKEKANIFLTAEIVSNKIYTEQKTEYILRLYHIPQISNVSVDVPEVDGLEITRLDNGTSYQTVYNSINYKVVQVKFLVTPKKPGKYKIYSPSMTLTAQTSRKKRSADSFFPDEFFSMGRGEQQTIAGNTVNLEVATVPAQNKPSDFTGLVGSFTINASLDPVHLKAGETSTLTVTVKGSGNIKRIPDLKLPDLPDAKIYADNPQVESSGDSGTKTMKWAIVPQKEGSISVPSVGLSYFDARASQYKQIKTQPFTLTVEKGNLSENQAPFQRKEEVKEIGKDILPVHTTISFSKNPSWIWLAAPLLIYLAILMIFGLRKKGFDQIKKISARPAAVFAKQCSKHIKAEQLSEALRDYFNAKFNQSLGILTPADASRLLTHAGCSDETIRQFEVMLRDLETNIYTGKAEETCDSSNAKNLIKQIDREAK